MYTDKEHLERRKIVRNKLLKGTIGAITIDTNIFTETGYSLEHGHFKQLEQFKGNKFNLIFSDVILMEVLGHLSENSVSAKQSLSSALRLASKSWGFDRARNQIILDELMSNRSPESIASDRLKDFQKRTDYQPIESKPRVDTTELLRRYFQKLPPFEKSKDKKAEFPDAIALLSLNEWALEKGKEVLVVTKDNGWHQFCDEDNKLFSINDLGIALTLIQERDQQSATQCSQISSLISAGQYPLLLDAIETAIADDIWSINWEVDADSSYYFDFELQNVEVISADFEKDGTTIELWAVDYREGQLVAQAGIHLEIALECQFDFEIKDGVDRDMVPAGSATVAQKQVVEVEVLLTFSDLESELPRFVEAEVVPSRRYIYLGLVEPDYGDQNPEDEKY